MSDDIWVLGTHMTKFGRYRDKDLIDLGAEAAMAALEDAGVTMGEMGIMGCGNLAQASEREQLGQVALTGTRKIRLIFDLGIELSRGLPEHAERSLTAAVIPDTGGDDAIPTRHTRHLRQSRDGMRHEVHDQLC